MTINAGIWIDDHRAVVVLITGEVEQVLHTMPNHDTPAWLPGGARVEYADSLSDMVPEGNHEGGQRTPLDVNRHYDRVIACLKNPEGILVMGPGESKSGLIKRMGTKKINGQIVPVVTVDKMTDCEIVAHVRQMIDVISKSARSADARAV